MKALIIAGGDCSLTSQAFIQRSNAASLIIAVDSGARHCTQHRIMPTYLLGDLDSISTSDLQKLETEIPVFRFPRDKDYLDIELAIRLAEREGASSIEVIAALDHRFDYSWGALLAAQNSSVPLTIYTDDEVAVLLNAARPELRWTTLKPHQERTSILSFDSRTCLISQGLRWEISWEEGSHIPRQSLSNEKVSQTGFIQVLKGSAWVFCLLANG